MLRPLAPSPLPRALAALLLGLCLAASGCAIGNKAEIQMVRHISFGQELIDLRRAVGEGAITEGEFQEMKQKLFELADLDGVVQIHHDVDGDDDHGEERGDHD